MNEKIIVEGDTSQLEEIVNAVTAISEKIGRIRDDAEERSRKKQLIEYQKYFDEQARIAKESYEQTVKGFRQSHGYTIKHLKKEAQELKDLFDSLYREPAKFKDFKPFAVTEDIMRAMTRDLGQEMIDAGVSIRKNIEEHAKEQKKHISLYKEWRKGLTGVLIDLHWLRILGANSRILAANTQMLGRAFGYLVDTILLPILPEMIKLTKYIFEVAKWIGQLPKPVRMATAVIGALAIGATVLGTILTYATTALNAFSAAVTAATVAETGRAAATGAVTTIVGAAIGGGIVSKFKPGAFFAPEMFPAMKGLGGEGEYSHDPRERLKILGKMLGLTGFAEGGIATSPTLGIFGEKGAEAIIPLSKIGEVMGDILGSKEGFASTLGKAATGGGAVGGGLTTGDGGAGAGITNGLLAKGFTWVAMSVNEGFKINNKLLAAILALLAQFGGGGGGSSKETGIPTETPTETPIPTETPTETPIVSFAETAWAAITALAQAAWNEILNIAKGIWNGILELAKGIWDSILKIASEIWDSILKIASEIWDSILKKAFEIWDSIFKYVEDGFKGVIDAILSIIPGNQGNKEVEPSPTPTGPEGVGSGAPGTTPSGTTNRPPILMRLQKVFDQNGAYIGDWEIYSDGSKKWRPGANTPYVGTTEPPSGATETSPLERERMMGSGAGSASDIVTTITEAGDEYADTISGALSESGENTSSAVTGSSNSFVDVLVGSVTAAGNMVWNTVTNAVNTVTSGVTTVVNAVGDVLNTVNDWLTPTSGRKEVPPAAGEGPPPVVMTGGFTAENALGALTVVGAGGTAAKVVDTVVKGAVKGIGTEVVKQVGDLLNIPSFQSGGVMPYTGLAFLHEGETVLPKGSGTPNNTPAGITINNPTFVVSGRTDRELFESFMRLMKTEGARIH